MKIYLRLLSYDSPTFPIYGEKFEYDEWWGAYVIELELNKNPDVWDLLGHIKNNGYELEDSLDIRENVGEYSYTIIGEISESTYYNNV